MAVGSGLSSQLGFKAETTWGTAVTVDRFVPFVSESLDTDRTPLQSKGIFANALVLRTGQERQGVVLVDGDVQMEVYDRSIGLWLKHALGSVTTSGTTAPYTHTFTPGALTGLGLTVQVGKPDTSANVNPFTYAGIKVASWELACAANEIATLGFTLSGKSCDTTAALATASYSQSIGAMTAAGGSLTLGGTSRCIRNIKVSGDNKLDTNRLCVGQSTRDQPIEADLRDYMITADLEFKDMTDYNRWVSDTDAALVFQITKGTSSLTVNANVRAEGEGPKVKDRGLIIQNLSFRCVATDAGDSSALSLTYVTADSQP